MKALHVDLLPIKHQFYLIPDSAEETRMVSPTCIMLVLHLLHKNSFLNSSVMVSIYKTSFDEVWKNMNPGDGMSSRSFLGMPITRLHDASSTVTNDFYPPLSGGFFPDFTCFVFLNASVSSLGFVCVEPSLFIK